MNIATRLFNELHLTEQKSPWDLSIVLTTLIDKAASAYHLLGSKRSIYDFEDDSRIVWRANTNTFEINVNRKENSEVKI